MRRAWAELIRRETYKADECIAGAAYLEILPLPTLALRLPTRLLRAVLLRGTASWLFARFAAVVVISLAKEQGLDVGAALTPLWALLITPGVVLVDLQRRKEIALLHNLGVTTRFAVAVGTVPALLIETTIAVLTAVRA